jgi:uncharacterized lipoprotein NlpE involved in copper resistance
MRDTKGISFVDIKLHLALMTIVLALTLSGCNENSNQDEVTASSDTLSAPLPNALNTLVIDETNLVVEVSVDGGVPQACTNLTVNQGNETFSCHITLSAGAHTLILFYSVIDATYGTVQVATTSGINVDVIPGQTTPADLSTAMLTYDDFDGDGISNLDELDAGTNPGDDECILNHSLIHSCTLG